MKAYFFLSSFSEHDMAWIVESGFKKIVPKGTPLIVEGRNSEHLYILLDGSIDVTKENVGLLATLQRGEVLGEISLVDNRLPLASVSTNEDSVVFYLSKENIESKINSDPSFGKNFYKAMAMFLADRLRVSAKGGSDTEDELKGQINQDLLKTLQASGQRFFSLLESKMQK